MLPVTIHKATIGLIGIFIVGFVGFGVTAAAAAYEIQQYGRGDAFAMLLIAVAILIVLITIIQAIVYELSTVVLTDQQLNFTNYTTLLISNAAECEWANIQDVDVKKGGIFAVVFDYGTLLIQTAGTERNLKLPKIPNPEYWRDFIMRKADVAAHRVTLSQ